MIAVQPGSLNSRRMQAANPHLPKTSIILGYNMIFHKFESTNFNAAQTQGRVTQQDVDKVVDEVNALPNASIKQSCLFYVIPTIVYLGLLVILGGGFYYFITNIGTFVDENSFIIFPVVSIGVTLLILFVIIGSQYAITAYKNSRLRKRLLGI